MYRHVIIVVLICALLSVAFLGCTKPTTKEPAKKGTETTKPEPIKPPEKPASAVTPPAATGPDGATTGGDTSVTPGGSTTTKQVDPGAAIFDAKCKGCHDPSGKNALKGLTPKWDAAKLMAHLKDHNKVVLTDAEKAPLIKYLLTL